MISLPEFLTASLTLGERSWSWWAIDIVAKATLILLVAGLAVALARGASAAVRHRIWGLALISLALLPLLGSVLPQQPWEIVPRDWQPAMEAPRAESSEPPLVLGLGEAKLEPSHASAAPAGSNAP